MRPLPLFGSFPGTKKEVARPSCPARPVRPIRCTYESKSSGELGRSKFTTWATPLTSIPRAATSVATKTGLRPALKAARADSRCDCERSPWMLSAGTPSRHISRATQAAVRFFVQNTRVRAGGGASASAARRRPSLARLSFCAHHTSRWVMAETVDPTRPTVT